MPTGKRKSTGKRLRFEIFKRDHFTCRYCGAQPPDVVLVVDHITAVTLGGETVPENLLTSCEACNQGKAARPLGAAMIRPDADLLYLEAQQEIAELRRYQVARAEREAALGEVVSVLQTAWMEQSALDWAPAAHIIRYLLARYSVEVVDQALLDVAEKVGSGYLDRGYAKGYSGDSRWVAYLYKVAATMAREYEYDTPAGEGDGPETHDRSQHLV